MRKKCTIISSQSGSSLIAVALFVAAMGLLMTAGIYTYRQYDQTRRGVETQENLEFLRRTIMTYYAQNGRFPCPAPLTVPPSDARYGREAAVPCTQNTDSGGPGPGPHGGGGVWGWVNGVWGWVGSNPPSGPGGYTEWHGNGGADIDESGTVRATGDGSKRIRIGSVPTRELNLPDTAAIDGYRHRIVYAVVEQMASIGAPDVSNPGAIDIEDRSGNNASRNNAILLLLSNGGDESGAWDINGTPLKACDGSIVAGSNCDYDGDFVYTLNKSDRAGSQYFLHRMVYIAPDSIGKN